MKSELGTQGLKIVTLLKHVHDRILFVAAVAGKKRKESNLRTY